MNNADTSLSGFIVIGPHLDDVLPRYVAPVIRSSMMLCYFTYLCQIRTCRSANNRATCAFP